ncbi:MAG: VCBS repeat-containing protein [Bacteroidetes bacterium]|nr:VCBS repeat-containing protein [Bacteroidota bacterium]
MLVLSVLSAAELSAQLRTLNSLNTRSSFSMPAEIRFPVPVHASPAGGLLGYRTDSNAVVLLRNDGTGQWNNVRTLARTQNVTDLTAGDLNNDGLDDVVIVHRDQNSVEVLMSRRSDSAYVSSTYPVNFYPERALIGDITGDRIPDIISYGKLSSGLSILQGRQGGRFLPQRTLFENIPVSDCSLIALNGDAVPDVALHNWLTNETTIHLGLGKLKFSEQTVLSFAQDTVRTLFTDLTGDNITDVAVLSLQNGTVQVLHGDGLGNFSFAQITPLSALSYRITAGAFTSVRKDLLVFDNAQRTAALLINRGDGTFYDEIVYGTGAERPDVVITDMNYDNRNDAVIIAAGEGRYTVLWNAGNAREEAAPRRTLAVGASPSNLYVGDITSDGLDDIVVSNEGSSTVSILASNGTSFGGQLTVETPERPVSVSLYARSDSGLTLYTAHREDPRVALYGLRREQDTLASLVGDVEQFSIALPERPVNVLPDVSYMQKGISLYAFMSTAPNAIVFYQQVKGTRFLAKSLVPLVPSRIAYSTINDLNYDGKTDLLYVTAGGGTKASSLGVTMNDSTGEFKGKVFSYAVADSQLRRALVMVEDFNGDQRKDCLLYSAPEQSLRLALGIGDAMFGPFERIIDSITVNAPEQLQVYDVENDGIMDIVHLNREDGSLTVHRGKGNGRFERGRTVAVLPGTSVFRWGDFNGDGAADLVYTDPGGVSITVEYGRR